VTGVRDEFLLKWFGGGGHVRNRFLSVCGSLCPVQASPVRERDSDLCPDRRGLRKAGIPREMDQPLRKE